jgi:hypothetical protein
MYGDVSGKITGMILQETPVAQIITYCANKDLFYSVIAQANAVLQQALANAAQAQAVAAPQ